MAEYGSCIVCGRKVKNRVYHKGMLIHICPRHLKSENKKEISEYLDNPIKNKSKEVKQYDDMMKSLLIIKTKITTLSDKVKAWMDVIGQRRLEDYKISRDITKILNKIDELTEVVDETNRSLKMIQGNSKNAGDYDELRFLDRLLKEYDEVHYKIEDGIVIVYLKSDLESKRFKELSKRLRDRGYAYDHRAYRWVKSRFS